MSLEIFSIWTLFLIKKSKKVSIFNKEKCLHSRDEAISKNVAHLPDSNENISTRRRGFFLYLKCKKNEDGINLFIDTMNAPNQKIFLVPNFQNHIVG